MQTWPLVARCDACHLGVGNSSIGNSSDAGEDTSSYKRLVLVRYPAQAESQVGKTLFICQRVCEEKQKWENSSWNALEHGNGKTRVNLLLKLEQSPEAPCRSSPMAGCNPVPVCDVGTLRNGILGTKLSISGPIGSNIISQDRLVPARSGMRPRYLCFWCHDIQVLGVPVVVILAETSWMGVSLSPLHNYTQRGNHSTNCSLLTEQTNDRAWSGKRNSSFTYPCAHLALGQPRSVHSIRQIFDSRGTDMGCSVVYSRILDDWLLRARYSFWWIYRTNSRIQKRLAESPTLLDAFFLLMFPIRGSVLSPTQGYPSPEGNATQAVRAWHTDTVARPVVNSKLQKDSEQAVATPPERHANPWFWRLLCTEKGRQNDKLRAG